MTDQRGVRRKQECCAQWEQQLRQDERRQRRRQRYQDESRDQRHRAHRHRAHFTEPRVDPANRGRPHDDAHDSKHHEEIADLIGCDFETIVQVQGEDRRQRVEREHRDGVDPDQQRNGTSGFGQHLNGRPHDVVVRPDQCVRELAEQRRILGQIPAHLLDVISVVQPDAHHFARPRHQRRCNQRRSGRGGRRGHFVR